MQGRMGTESSTGEDRVRIPKPPLRAWDREKAGTTAFDLLHANKSR